MMIFMLIIVLTGIISLLFNYKRLDIEVEEIDDVDDEERNITEDERFNSNDNITE
jgi:hypothetical protein